MDGFWGSGHPYGQVRIDKASSTYSGSKRKYIGQFNDTQSTLDYLNARYYQETQGQFISQDPVFQGIPNRQNTADPQSLNAYSYSEDNPIIKSDPTGRDYVDTNGAITFPTPFGFSVGPSADYLYNLSGNNNDPYLTFGIAVTAVPGPSGQVTYASGNPSDGLNGSASFMPGYVAINGGASIDSSGKYEASLSPGAGGPRGAGLSTRSFGATIGITLRASQWNDLFGPFQEQTTVAMAINSYSYVNSNSFSNSSAHISGNSQASYSASGASSGSLGLQLQILQLQVKVLQLQLQIAQSTPALAKSK